MTPALDLSVYREALLFLVTAGVVFTDMVGSTALSARLRQEEADELRRNFFAVLREADLVDIQKVGKTVIYRLKLSVLEDALLGFVGAFSAATRSAKTADAAPDAPIKGTTS